MGETPENPSIKGGHDRPFSKGVKKSGLSLKLLFDCDNDSYEAIPCSNDENCPYCRLKVGDVWKLINKNGGKVILEADDVVDDEDGELEFLDSKPIIRIFHSGSGWGFIADDGTIVHGDYIKMNLYALEVNNYQYTIAKGETLENGHEKIWYFSLKDGFKSDDLESLKNKCIEENPYHNNEKGNSKKEKVKEFKEKVKSGIKKTVDDIKDNFEKFAVAYADNQYNYHMIYRKKFSLKQGTKQGYSYMKNGKVGIEGILEPKYDELKPCSENFIWMRVGEKRGLLDADGNILIEPQFDDVDENTYEMDGKRGFINENGEALGHKYDFIYGNYVFDGKKCGLVDRKTGREIIAPEYDDVICPLKGCSVAVVVLGNKYGLISTIDGSIIKNIEYDAMIKDYTNNKITFFKKDVVNCRIGEKYDIMPGNIVKVAGKMGMVNKETGLEIIEPKYDKIWHPFKGRPVVLVKLGDKYGLISEIDGSIIKNVEFDRVKIRSRKERLSFYKKDVVDCNPYKKAA